MVQDRQYLVQTVALILPGTTVLEILVGAKATSLSFKGVSRDSGLLFKGVSRDTQ